MYILGSVKFCPTILVIGFETSQIYNSAKLIFYQLNATHIYEKKKNVAIKYNLIDIISSQQSGYYNNILNLIYYITESVNLNQTKLFEL